MVEYVYDAWGNHAVLDANGNDLTDPNHIGNRNPFRYRGYFYDVETGLYYLQTRYYDPEIGRFLNMDDISYATPEQIHGLNLYAYCANNPVMNTEVKNIGINLLCFRYTGKQKLIGLLPSRETSAHINWGNGGFNIPIWISSLLAGSDFGASVAPILRTLYQYARYPEVKDLNRLYGLDIVPGKLNAICSAVGYGLLAINIGLSAGANFTNDELTTGQKWISFGVDTAYTLGTFGIGYAVGAAVSLIPGVGVFIAPFVSAAITLFIDWTNNMWGWVDDIKQWLNSL